MYLGGRHFNKRPFVYKYKWFYVDVVFQEMFVLHISVLEPFGVNNGKIMVFDLKGE